MNNVDDSAAAPSTSFATPVFWPARGRTQIELAGDDRKSFLHGLTTNHIKRLEPWQGCETFLCNAQGKTIGHGWVFSFPETLVFDTVPGHGPALIKYLDRYLFREQVTLHDRTDEWSELVLGGANVQQVLGSLGVVAPPISQCQHIEATIGGARVSVRRVDWLQGDCYALSCDTANASVVEAAVRDAGAAELTPAAWEAARIEAGCPLFDRDITPDNLPQEVARDTRSISFEKGCYLGQETVARLDMLGHVNRRLVRVRWPSGTAVPTAGTELVRDGKVVGRVTSVAWSERWQAPIALAYVRRPLDVRDADGWVVWNS